MRSQLTLSLPAKVGGMATPIDFLTSLHGKQDYAHGEPAQTQHCFQPEWEQNVLMQVPRKMGSKEQLNIYAPSASRDSNEPWIAV
jgi:hypothetical protein